MSIDTNSFSITNVEGVYVGAYGAAKGASTDMGSVKKAEASTEYDTTTATSAKLRGAVVLEEPRAGKASLKLTGIEQATAANIALMMGGTVSGNRILIGPASAITYKTLYIDGFDYEGGQGTLHVKKCSVKPGTTVGIGEGEAFSGDLEFNVVADTTQDAGEEFMAFDPFTADTTAPTVSFSPAHAASGVTVSSNITITFSEEVRSSDVVYGESVNVTKADGTLVAGALSTTDNTVWTFDPTSNLSASSDYIVIVSAGIRDVAGNELAAAARAKFTTA